MNETSALTMSLCRLKQLFTGSAIHKKKDKCCKSYKDGKRCRKCPKK